jgi:hypothetical protein
LLAGIDRSPFFGRLSIFPTTVKTTVNGRNAFYVQWTAAEKRGAETTRAIYITVGQGFAYTLTLSAPQAEWAASNPAFDQILASITFPQGPASRS